jgi:hypothetical protein
MLQIWYHDFHDFMVRFHATRHRYGTAIFRLTFTRRVDASQIRCRNFPVDLRTTRRSSIGDLPDFFSLISNLPPPQTTTFNISTVMSTDWTSIFFQTLTKYVMKYIGARGDQAARAQILKKCGEVIMNSPLHEEQKIELPKALCYVSISFH